jgi:cell envelope opacity-associated protein A
MANFKKGDTVKVASVIPQGPVESMRMDEDGNVQYLLSWTDASGNVHSRWFDESALVSA